jgi:hypothetical protein
MTKAVELSILPSFITANSTVVSVNATSYNIGTSFIANTTAIIGTGFANVTTSVNSALLTVGTSFIANTTGVYHTGVLSVGNTTTQHIVPAANITYDIGTATMRYRDLYLSGNTINLGDIKLSTNGTAFSVANATGGVFPSALGNTTVTGTLQTTDTITVGNSTVNSIIHTTGITANGAGIHSINATSIATGTLDTARLPATANISTAINVGANVGITTTGVSVGNSTVNTTINSTGITSNSFTANNTATGNLTVTGSTVLTGSQFVNGTVTFANSTGNNILISANGRVGIGSGTVSTESPLYIRTNSDLHVLHLDSSNSYCQIIYQANNYRYQAGVGYVGAGYGVSNSFFIFDGNATSMRFVISANGNVSIGNSLAKEAKLNFDNDIGNKIDFYHSTGGSGDRYGVQVQSSELRIHSGAAGASNGGITFGKSTTSTFTENARITNAGYLRVYNQPAFSAYGTSTGYTVNGSTIPFNTADFNVGGFYNTSTYTFTAPIAGKYFVSFSALIYPVSITTGHYITFYVSKNNAAYSGSVPMARMSFKEAQTTMGTDGIVDLAQGDTIKMVADASTTGFTLYLAAGHAHFAAYLLG